MPKSGQHSSHAEVKERMETGLTRISEKARIKADEQFTALMHHLSSSLLEDCHKELGGSKSPGVDGITKAILYAALNKTFLLDRLAVGTTLPITGTSSKV